MKEYLLATATTDERVEKRNVCDIYDEETMLNSDFKSYLPKEKNETITMINHIEYFPNPKEPTVRWVTTITRIV